MLNKITFVLIFLGWNLHLHAQSDIVIRPYSFESQIDAELYSLNQSDSIAHALKRAVKGFDPDQKGKLWFQRAEYMTSQSISRSDKWLARKIFREDLIRISKPDYQIVINPIFQGVIGKDFASQTDTLGILYRNARGVQLYGQIGKNVFFYTDVHEVLQRHPQYINTWIEQNRKAIRIIPGQGPARTFDNDTKVDFSFVNGFVGLRAGKHFYFEFGQGKNFIGHGYRSFLISDNSFTLPYGKIRTTLGRATYTVLYLQAKDIGMRYDDGIFINKYISAHHLEVPIGKKILLGLFETVVYADSTGRRGLDVNYWNPILFFRPIEYALGSTGGNVLIGSNLYYSINKKIQLFGQFILDELRVNEIFSGNGWRGNKFALQIGARVDQPFGIRSLVVHSELNLVRPYMYAHKWPIHNYSHYGQSLTHPLGANFIESVSHFKWQKDRWFCHAQLNWQKKGYDADGLNWGGDIFKTNFSNPKEYGNTIAQGFPANTIILNLNAGYIVNPKYDLRLSAGLVYRRFSKDESLSQYGPGKTNYFHISLASNLYNTYLDF